MVEKIITSHYLKKNQSFQLIKSLIKIRKFFFESQSSILKHN